MRSKCLICGKGRLKGNWVPRLIGRRVPRRTIRFQKPNIQKVTLEGESYVVCTTCLKTIKRELRNSALEKQNLEAEAQQVAA